MTNLTGIFKYNNISPLSLKLLAYILIFSSVFTIFATSFQLYTDYRRDVGQIAKQMELIKSSYLSPLAGYVWNVDKSQAEILLSNILNLPDIQYVELVDVTTELTVHSGIKKTKESSITHQFALNYVISESETVHLGELYATATLDNVYSHLSERILVILATQTVKTFFVSLFIFLISYYMVTRHLVAIAKYATSMDLERLDRPLKLDRKLAKNTNEDELDQLISSLNGMRIKIHDYIIKREQAEESLKISNDRYYQVTTNLPGLVYQFAAHVDGSYSMPYVSDGVKSMFGVSADEVNQDINSLFQFIHPDDVSNFEEYIRKSVCSRSPHNHEFRTLINGGVVWVHALSRPKQLSNGDIAWDGILLDISERKRAEEDLRESEEEFRNLFEDTPVSSWLEDFSGLKKHFDALREEGVSDIETYFQDHPEWLEKCIQCVKIKDVNQATLDLHQAKSKEQLFKGLETTYTPELLDVFKKEMIDVWNGKKQATYDAVIRTFIDELRYVTISYKIAPGHEKSLDKVLVTLVDITAKTLADKQKNKLEMQLHQARKMEAIGTLAGGIAHDFNNILAVILGYAEIARDKSLPESPVAKDLDKVLEGGARAKDLVQQILAFSRQNELERIPLQPVSVVKEAIKMLRPSLPATIEINQDISSVTGQILADPTQAHQIVMNLCTNAFHAMEDAGGRLDISLKEVALSTKDLVHEPHVEPGTFIQLSIRDSGPGIDPDIKNKIFDPYFTTKETGKGTGMGLSIVHGIVKNYGGFISCDSEVGEGSVFRVFLPVIEKELLPEVEDVEPIPVGRARILFIDDEEMLAEMGKCMLERLGYHVTVSSNSIEALETFQNQPDLFDLVITDQTMPGMTGADIARRMIQIRSDIPIILCTGYSTVISEKKAKSMGIKEFALKPLSVKDIAVLIRKVLDSS